MNRRVVITGIGGITPLGEDINNIWNNLIGGVSGIKNISLFNPTDFNMEAKIAGEITEVKVPMAAAAGSTAF